jgi:hypothetical protein
VNRVGELCQSHSLPVDRLLHPRDQVADVLDQGPMNPKGGQAGLGKLELPDYSALNAATRPRAPIAHPDIPQMPAS